MKYVMFFPINYAVDELMFYDSIHNCEYHCFDYHDSIIFTIAEQLRPDTSVDSYHITRYS